MAFKEETNEGAEGGMEPTNKMRFLKEENGPNDLNILDLNNKNVTLEDLKRLNETLELGTDEDLMVDDWATLQLKNKD